MHWHSEGHFNWVAWLNCMLREVVGKHLVIINQGIGGDTATNLLERFDRDIVPLQPTAVIVTIGGNDANRGVSLDQYRNQLQEIISKIQRIGAIPILQTYYCPLYDKMGDAMQRFPHFVTINRSLADDFQLPLIDQYAYFEPFYRQNPKQYRKIMKDGLHVNPMGNLIMGYIACNAFGLPPLSHIRNRLKFYFFWGLIQTYRVH
jgi:lysophospholipase L1-like esterase